MNFTLYILSPTNVEELSSLSFISEKLSSLILVSLGLKGKGLRFEKGKTLWAEGRKVCSYACGSACVNVSVCQLAKGMKSQKINQPYLSKRSQKSWAKIWAKDIFDNVIVYIEKRK